MKFIDTNNGFFFLLEYDQLATFSSPFLFNNSFSYLLSLGTEIETKWSCGLKHKKHINKKNLGTKTKKKCASWTVKKKIKNIVFLFKSQIQFLKF